MFWVCSHCFLRLRRYLVFWKYFEFFSGLVFVSFVLSPILFNDIFNVCLWGKIMESKSCFQLIVNCFYDVYSSWFFVLVSLGHTERSHRLSIVAQFMDFSLLVNVFVWIKTFSKLLKFFILLLLVIVHFFKYILIFQYILICLFFWLWSTYFSDKFDIGQIFPFAIFFTWFFIVFFFVFVHSKQM